MQINPKLRKWRKAHMAAHDLMRVVAANGENQFGVARAQGIRGIGGTTTLLTSSDQIQGI